MEKVTYGQVVAAKNLFEPLNENLFQLIDAARAGDVALQAVFSAGEFSGSFGTHGGFGFSVPSTREVLELDPAKYGQSRLYYGEEGHTIPMPEGEAASREWASLYDWFAEEAKG